MGTGPDGTTYTIGEMAGTEQETLSVNQIPTHTHAVIATSDGATTQTPTSQVLATSAAQIYYNSPDAPVTMAPSSIGPAGGSQPHENTQPFLCVNFIISLFGIYPSQT